MGLLSATLLAETRKRTAPLYWAVELNLPGGMKRYSLNYVASISQGLYHGKVHSISPITRSVSGQSGSLQVSDVTVVLDDTDRTLQALIEGASGSTVRGSAATIKLASTEVAAASWFTAFSGTVASWDVPAPLRIRLRLTNDDLPLRRPAPKLVVSRGDWPLASDREVVGRPIPVVLGAHKSNGLGDTGALPCLYVDTTNYVYLVSRGYLKSVDRVFVDGRQVYSHWAITHPIVRGRVYTCIDFDEDAYAALGDTEPGTETGATKDPRDAKVTCDATGLEATGDGSGALITNPVTQIWYWLKHFLFSDYTSGAWPSPTVPIDTTSFTAAQTWATEQGYIGAYVVGREDAKPALDILNEWDPSHGLSVFWTNSGQIGCAFDNHRFQAIYGATIPHWRWDLHEFNDAAASTKREYDQIIDRVHVQYGYQGGSGQYGQSLTVADLNLDELAQDELSLPGFVSSLV